MIPIKTAEQIDAMREWWIILRSIHEEIWAFLKPWISTMDIEKFAETLFKKHWTTPSFKWYNWFPCILCTSVNEVVVHGIPSTETILKSWDIISVDCGSYHKGMHTDSCQTHFIWEVSQELKDLSNTVKKAMNKWIKQVKPWARVWDIESVVQKTLERAGYCPIYDCTWHWVWAKLHEAPEILNYWTKWKGPVLKQWMCLAIEPSATLWYEDTTFNKNWDKWTLVAKDETMCCQWEHTVLVTANGFEILT